ncbi:MAG TPA: hypothetical protein VNX28_03205, partial [Gemmataceae bacterium]|nr:hypothetical protein [Gemmataceae bacterium]
FIESARVFAQEILTRGPEDLEGRLTYAFRAAVARAPTPAELAVLKARYQSILDRYRSDPDAASKVVSAGMAPRAANLDITLHAAWTGVAHMLLNLDETITRE